MASRLWLETVTLITKILLLQMTVTETEETGIDEIERGGNERGKEKRERRIV